MSDRAEFEGVIQGLGYVPARDVDCYLYEEVEVAWQAWQATRAQSGQGAEPVAWLSDAQETEQEIDGRPRRVWRECKKGVGTPFYTRPPSAGAPEAITAVLLESIWQDGFDAENIGDRDCCDSLILARIAVEDAPQPPQEGSDDE